MRVLVCPDSLKGSLSAVRAALAIARGVRLGSPGADIDLCPLSDGGEGFGEVLAGPLGATEHPGRVTGPLGAPVVGRFHLLPDRTALVESASAIGLGLVPGEGRRVMETTSFGVGELIVAALDAGAARVIVGLGGTATTDAGAGMAQALGVTFDGVPDVVRGEQLADVTAVQLRAREPRLVRTPVLALTDVDNPLLGDDGAARRYAPQKGASPEQVELLERALAHFASVVGDRGDTPGDGAAGGLAYGLRVFAGAERRRGIDFVLDALGFDQRLEGVDLVITGEGRLDAQSARGKVVSGVAERCARRGVPVIALAGSIDASVQPTKLGLTAAFSLVQGPVTLVEAMQNAEPWLESLAASVTRIATLHDPSAETRKKPHHPA